MNESQLLIRRHMEDWIKQHKNAGMQMIEKLKIDSSKDHYI